MILIAGFLPVCLPACLFMCLQDLEFLKMETTRTVGLLLQFIREWRRQMEDSRSTAGPGLERSWASWETSGCTVRRAGGVGAAVMGWTLVSLRGFSFRRR